MPYLKNNNVLRLLKNYDELLLLKNNVLRPLNNNVLRLVINSLRLMKFSTLCLPQRADCVSRGLSKHCDKRRHAYLAT